MTESDIPGNHEYGPNELLGEESGSRFRQRQQMALIFGEIVRQLEAETEEPELSEFDRMLNAISRIGLNEVAAILRDHLQFESEPYEPANPSEVIQYLSWLSTSPPIKIEDVGSIDEGLVLQLRLSKRHFTDEIMYLLSFIDSEKTNSLSVLSLPDVRVRMLANEQNFIKKALINTVLNEHGISYVLDFNDPKAWNELGLVIQDLAQPYMRDYSRSLRQKARGSQGVPGDKTPIRDVYATIAEYQMIRENALHVALKNVNSAPDERSRVIEGLAQYMRPLVRSFLEDLDALQDKTPEV